MKMQGSEEEVCTVSTLGKGSKGKGKRKGTSEKGKGKCQGCTKKMKICGQVGHMFFEYECEYCSYCDQYGHKCWNPQGKAAGKGAKVKGRRGINKLQDEEKAGE